MKRHSQQGFTLIEVLAALIIVSLGMLAVIQAFTQTINNANYLREKTIAHWVAMNKLTEVRLSNTAPPGGETSGDVDMAGTTWHWRMKIDVSLVQGVQRIDIQVAPKSAGEKASIASAMGVYGSAITKGGSVEWGPNPNLKPAGGSSSSSSSASS
jgi:general secretion pathway protein I